MGYALVEKPSWTKALDNVNFQMVDLDTGNPSEISLLVTHYMEEEYTSQ